MKSSQAISSQLSLNELVSEAMSIIMENAGAQVGALVLNGQNGDTTKATLEAFVDQPNNLRDYLQHKNLANVTDLPVSLIALSLRTGELVNLEDACQTGNYTHTPYIAEKQIKSLLCVPINYRDNLLGVLYLENNLVTGAFTEERLDVIYMLLTQASISFENARLFTEIKKLNTDLEAKVASKTKKLLSALEEQVQLNDQLLIKTSRLNKANEKLTLFATVDGLTGAFNRRHFLELADNEIARSCRYRNPVSVLMLDIDFFKKVNDQYGHAAGDEALRKVSAACKNSLREQDIFGRLGGEEFAIILPETRSAGGAEIAERIRKTIEELSIKVAAVNFNVTISIGLTQLSQYSNPKQTATELLQIADLALYQSKENGRNQVTEG
jgi:diguanylate cyclase (GGDEF)-like protein